ncbi:MAG: hypothetical protein JWP91_4617 [Fibrobacteres bacterium]|nr:hypothetical protein [Fibrobacterota bacterium]
MGPARIPSRLIVLLFSLLPAAAQAGAVITGTFGADSRDHYKGAQFGYSAAFYAKFDDMTLLGIQSGQGTVGAPEAIPLLGSAMVRLPIGWVVLPVAIGDIGYAFDDTHPGILWRAGGGFDIRNGRHSSILALGAYERAASRYGWMGRLGLLLEF